MMRLDSVQSVARGEKRIALWGKGMWTKRASAQEGV